MSVDPLGFINENIKAKAQKKAAAINAQSAQDTNDKNKVMFDESRGSTGSAVLPTYLKSRNGGLFEEQLGRDIVQGYDDSFLPYEDFESVVSRYKPMQEQSSKVGESIFDGGLEGKMLANAAPVQKARVAFKRQSAIDALNKTLAGIEATQSSKGYNGDSYGARRLKLDANRGASSEIAGASFDNLMETKAIKDAILNLQLGNLDLPSKLAANATSLVALPGKSYADYQNARMTPLNMLRIGPGQFQYQNMPLVEPIYNGALGLFGAQMAQSGSQVAQGVSRAKQAQAWQNYANKMDAWSNAGPGMNWNDWSGDYDYNGFDMSGPQAASSWDQSFDYGGEFGGGGSGFYDSPSYDYAFAT